MSRIKLMGVLSVLLNLSTFVTAQDVSGRWGVTGLAMAGMPVGDRSTRQQADDVGPLLGGMLRYGVSRHWSLGASYENFDAQNGIRVEPVLLNGIYHFTSENAWQPSLLVGAGASRGVDAKNFNHIAAKAGAGLDYFFTPDFSFGPQVSYHYVSDVDDSVRHLHSIDLGFAASYFFGGASAPAPVKQAAAAPAPTPAAIALALNPASATLGPSQTQAFQPSVSGSSNKAVTWSIAPSLGSIDSNGVYTAPAQIALAEKVSVTATSVADGSKSASSVVSLVPPANAAQQVNIELKVLFDTAKDVVKPEFRPEIQKVADFMKTYASSKAEIEGHTDSMGDDAMNQGLSQRRADSVRRYLVEQFGVSADRLSAKGYGETRPMADNKTAEGRATNRRVIATISASK